MDTIDQVAVLVRDHEQILRLSEISSWDAMTILAAVSSDPRSHRELGLAWSRYRRDQVWEELPWEAAGQSTPAGDWLLIDLACQRLVANDQEMIPSERAAFQETEGKWRPDTPVIWCSFAPWWERSTSSALDQALLPLPELREPVDFRGILYGRAMTESLAERMAQIMETESVPAEYICWDDLPWDGTVDDERKQMASRWSDLTRRVHADWLMTPRSDLGGEAPRMFLHRGREWVEWEVENRQRQWSHLKHPPRALDRDTHAYRHGPMGRDEVVIYFDMCREVLKAGWKLLRDPTVDQTDLGRQLFDHANCWLTSGSIGGTPIPPAEIIESSRRQMPRLADGSHVDCDCPICRMMVEDSDANSFSPMFAGFDGHHLELEDEFAFSLCETREEWEAEQEEYQRFSDEMERKRRERKDRGEVDEFGSVWQTSIVTDQGDDPAAISTMTLAFRLAELITDLKTARVAASTINTLNELFDALRTAEFDPLRRDITVEAVQQQLELLGGDHPDLVGKVADLQSKLDEWSRRPANDIPL